MKFVKIGLLLLVPFLLLASLVVLITGAASYRVYVIHTGSMSPNIPSGSAVLVHEGHYRVGQVITFTEDGLTVTHRLVSIDSEGIITTKGDGNPTNDPWHVPKSQIIGGVVVAPRYVGYWIMYFKNPLGLASVLLAVLALWQIWSLTSREDPNDIEKPLEPRFRHVRTVRATGGPVGNRRYAHAVKVDSVLGLLLRPQGRHDSSIDSFRADAGAGAFPTRPLS